MLKLSREDKKAIGLLLTPSWLSGLIAVLAGLIVCVGTIAIFHYNDTTMQKQLIGWQQSKPEKALTTPDQVLEENDKPTLKGSWPLIVVWSLTGLVVYLIAVYIVHSIETTKRFADSMDYVNSHPETVLVATAERATLRIVSFIFLLATAYLVWHKVIPYGIMAGRVAALDLISLGGILSALLSFAVVALSFHVLAVLLRLSLGRPRTFSY